MLIPEKMDAIIRVLLNSKARLGLSQLAKRGQLSPAMAQRLVLRLQRTGYLLRKKGGIEIIDKYRLMKAWGYCYSIRELPRVEFVAAERPQFVMTKIANVARKHKLKIAFTLFSATELVRPYVAPDTTYAYIQRKDQKNWERLLRAEQLLPSQGRGDVILLLVDEPHFEGVWTVRELPIVSLPQLYADLFSFGGRGEEAAEEILTLIKEANSYV